MSMEQTKKVFLTIFLFAHGYASIIANNSMQYDEELIQSHLEKAYDKKKLPEMFAYYESNGCEVMTFGEVVKM